MTTKAPKYKVSTGHRAQEEGAERSRGELRGVGLVGPTSDCGERGAGRGIDGQGPAPFRKGKSAPSTRLILCGQEKEGSPRRPAHLIAAHLVGLGSRSQSTADPCAHRGALRGGRQWWRDDGDVRSLSD